MNEPIKITRENVFDRVNFVSKILYTWIFPLYRIGYSRPLEFTDLQKCSQTDEALKVTKKLEFHWSKELTKKKPSLLIALNRAFGWRIFVHNLSILVSDAIIRLSQPFMLQSIIKYLQQPADKLDGPDYISPHFAQGMSFLLVFSSICLQLSRHYAWFSCSMAANNIRTSLTALIYKKVLSLSRSSKNTFDLGQAINTIASDLSRFEDLTGNINGIACGPIMAVIAIWLTYDLIAESSFVGLAIILLMIPIQSIMGRLFNRYRGSTAAITDKRVRLMSEIISAIKLIKFYCWEESFANLIQAIRKTELSAILKSYYLKGTNAAFFFIGVRLMLFSSFVSYVALGNKLRPEIVYTVMTLYNAIRIPLTNRFPSAVGTLAESMVALERVQAILLSDEKVDDALINSKYNVKGSIVYVNYSAKWTVSVENESLRDININLKPGQLTVVIGSVGCGKTCLLWSLLGELHPTKGSINMNGVISYASQEPWCFNGSVKQNILLTDDIEDPRYHTVVDVCSLKRDLKLFPRGDDTLIGEKGYTLSGGQKARVALARAVYRQADYYLMDDPLSAVDPKVASHIFNQCIKGYLKEKTVILATHQLQFISQADCIIYMQNGAISARGSYEELMKTSNDFKEFIESRKKESEKKKNKLDREKSMSVTSFERKDSDISDYYEERPPETNVEREKEKVNREEKKETGSMDAIVYWRYFTSGNSILLLLLAIMVTLTTQGLNHFIELWMSAWTSREVSSDQASTVNQSIVFTSETANIAMYSILIVLLFILAFARVTLAHVCALRSAVALHSTVFKNILRAPMLFFETNPSGRILNRFTKDIGVIDSGLPSVIGDLNISLLQVLGIVITTVVVNWYMLFPVIVIVIAAVNIRNFHLKTARDLQRLDSIARSPVYSHIGETFNGLTTIRAMNVQEHMMSQYNRYLSDSIATRFLVVTVGRWIGLILDMFACVFMASICILLMLIDKHTISPGDAGVILSNAILLIGMFQGCIRSTVDLETQMISVERILEYSRLPSEPPAEIEDSKGACPTNWPSGGALEFKDVSMRYSPQTPLILGGVTFTVEAGEKIGIVGRTGAGKSSLITALFRLCQLESGKVILDNVDIAQLGLKKVRKSISIIPQDPSLFSGSIRRNLDPFNEHQDEKLWRALKEANLLELVQSIPGRLEGSLTEGGANLSVGQRQLLCLARALLRNNSILVLDEATANVDHETDEAIQLTIRKNFAHCTVLTIAHRLNTIIDMDKVLVMGSGRVLEYDEPYTLLQNINGEFFSMIKQTGPNYEKQLNHAAKIAHEARRDRKSRINFSDD